MEHHVYFWLKEESDRNDFEERLVELDRIEQIQRFHWGPPAPTEERPVSDQSWDYALSLNFATLEDHDAYQVHPLHDEFVEACKSMWTRVLVMDVG